MQKTTLVTREEYFSLLAKSDVKLEYHGGEIVAMAGAQPRHNSIAVNLTSELVYCLKSKGCIILNSDQLIKVEECDKYTFPDLVIVCEKPLYEKSPGGLDALLNPEIIIEVMSASTKNDDRLQKFDDYKTIPSFREYVLVSSERISVEVVKKLNEVEWLSHTYTDPDEHISIGSCNILMADIYHKVDWL